jgi:ribose transport system substrate-binding protein
MDVVREHGGSAQRAVARRRRTLRISSLAAGATVAALVAACGGGSSGAGKARASSVVRQAQAVVRQNLSSYSGYGGPRSGPRAVHDQLVVFVAADITNGGIAGVAHGVQQAARAIHWRLRILDGGASVGGRRQAMDEALALHPDGIILGGFNATEQHAGMARARAAGIPVVGWHAASLPGPDPKNGLFTNVSTDPLAVARVAADYVIARSKGRAGVAIFYDSEFQIAVEKADVMRAVIRRCGDCHVLAMDDVPISRAQALMPAVVVKLVRRYGRRLTDLLAINGNYFTGSAAGLYSLGIGGNAAPYAVAAGDGDASEFARIRSRDYQAASVAEPLYLQGWQLIDELNRALSHRPPSGYVPPPRLVTRDNVPAGGVFDPPTGYRQRYMRIWGG